MSFVICVLLVISKRLHHSFSMDLSEGVQKVHTLPTPRIGGISILLGIILASFSSPKDLQQWMQSLVLVGLPVFIFGFAEDLTKQVHVTWRLFASLSSGILAWWVTEYSLTRVDILGLDLMLQFTFVSVIFTCIAVSGVANSINIIDGFNGLASFVSSFSLLGYALIAYQVGDHLLFSLCMVLSASVLGFILVNWPLGKIFLGDGGALFLGFVIAWMAVLLVERNPTVSAFAGLLVCLHPVIEVIFSIYRRWIKKAKPWQPDRLHLHSLLHRRFVMQRFGKLPAMLSNSITGLLVGMMTLFSAIIANLVCESIVLSILAVVGMALVYLTIYIRLVRFHWSSPLNFFIVKITNALVSK